MAIHATITVIGSATNTVVIESGMITATITADRRKGVGIQGAMVTVIAARMAGAMIAIGIAEVLP